MLNFKMDVCGLFAYLCFPFLFYYILAIDSSPVNVQRQLLPRFPRDIGNISELSNDTDISFGSKPSDKITEESPGIDAESVKTSVIQTSEATPTSTGQMPEINTEVNTETLTSVGLNDTEKYISVTEISSTKINQETTIPTQETMTTLLAELMPTVLTENSTDINSSKDETNTINAKDLTGDVTGAFVHDVTNSVDIQPIDKLPKEETEAEPLEYVTKTNGKFTEAQQTSSEISTESPLLKETKSTNDFKLDSSPSTNDNYTRDQMDVKRTALAVGFDEAAKVSDSSGNTTIKLVSEMPLNNDTSNLIPTSLVAENTISTTQSTAVLTTTLAVSSTASDNEQITTAETNTAVESTSSASTTNAKYERTTLQKDTSITTKKEIITTLKPLASTTANADKSGGSDSKESEESMFGKYGLAFFIAACAVILCLLLVIVYILANKKRKQKEVDFMARDGVPKLRMLEIRDSALPGHLKAGKTAKKDDDLPTFSLDYEKHVQEKIEEHRKLVKNKSQNLSLPGAEATPLAGVSSFKIPRRPSAEGRRPSQKSQTGSQTGPTSPITPTSPEGKPLVNREEEPVVFNFAKKPGEATAAREARVPRRGSQPVTGSKMKSVTKSKDDFFVIDV